MRVIKLRDRGAGIEDTAPQIVYAGTWDLGLGNFSGGTIHHTTTAGDSAACTYRASQSHQLYLGTRKAAGGAQITVVVDGGGRSPNYGSGRRRRGGDGGFVFGGGKRTGGNFVWEGFPSGGPHCDDYSCGDGGGG